ncbi:glycogen debranching protein GlgX [Brachybacterium sillae]|uniref:glycogen debranching protein GlgX n=1 Tax=Brachybacterium sillae TaxID=2810536 RepID=UPI00217F211D|nr:glycogen debranching protein GlgX [Brachybacterium sillae]
MQVDADGRGVFAVAAPRATAVDLCVRHGATEERRRLRHREGALWWDEVEGMVPGTRYGLRVDGPWDPASGHWFNPARLLLDPWARGVSHSSPLLSAHFAHEVDSLLRPVGDGAPRRSRVDDADDAVWSEVVRDDFDWGGDARPRTPWRDTVIAELHVKGWTMQHPEVPPEQRGTYAGLAHPAVTGHLRELGVTAVELLPIHAALDEPHLARLGLTNYWGYSTLAYLAPDHRYASAAARRAGAQGVLDEVKRMVRALHTAGLEVILDVVYNHTAEGGADGPSVCWRGLDAHEHYWMDHGRFVDVTGTGATFDPRSQHVVDLILGSLRHWVEEVHIDGFRFDLAATLGRDHSGFRSDHPLLRAMTTDPVLRDVKLIAEPWDVGTGGWQTGGFPAPFAEWNDAFRNDVRSFWLEHPRERSRDGDRVIGGVRDLATRLAGSADVFRRLDPADLPAGASLRAPWAAIDYVTAHDGFTLMDLVSFEHKRNEANGEDGRDGTTDNRSWNHGVEGLLPEHEEIAARRRRTVRSLLATLLLGAGTPMLLGGDEAGRTQRGNNNAYCQDNEISWVDWSSTLTRTVQEEAVRTLTRLRRRLPQLRPVGWLLDVDPLHPGPEQVLWCRPDGVPMRHEDWSAAGARTLVMVRPGAPGGEHAVVVLHAGEEPLTVQLPDQPWLQGPARVVFDAAAEGATGQEHPVEDGAVEVAPGSVVVVTVPAGRGR